MLVYYFGSKAELIIKHQMLKLHKNNQFGYSVNIIPKEESNYLLDHCKPVLYTSSGDFPTYDEEMYQTMTQDHHRNRLYKNEIKHQVKNKIVVDIGTGAHANWALYAAQCGAARVYAIELIEDAYLQAKTEIGNSRYADRIILLKGLSTEVDLPEKADICISEILGCPASSEAVIAVLKDAQKRFLKSDARFIIDRCVTQIAVCSLGEDFKNNLGICETDLKYLDRAFNFIGKPFDIRVVIGNFPSSWIVSSSVEMENINFNEDLSKSNSISNSILINQDAKIDGFVCWIQLFGSVKHGQALDTLKIPTNWLPVFIPVFYPGLDVKKGDVIKYNIDIFLKSGEINPDYYFYGDVSRKGRLITEFEFMSAYVSEQFRENEFYKTLFPE